MPPHQEMKAHHEYSFPFALLDQRQSQPPGESQMVIGLDQFLGIEIILISQPQYP